jgi:hypothetical protein
LCEEILQPVLDEVPDQVYRQLPKANGWVKDHEWVSVIRWIEGKRSDNDPCAILATSEDDANPERVNLLGTLAAFRPDVGLGRAQKSHAEAAALIIKAFYNAGLINMRLGKHRETALLKAASCGNMEIAVLLLEYGAGIPLWLLPGYSPLVTPLEGMHS